MDGVLQESLLFNESMLHDLNMGYYDLKTMTPHSSVGYFPAEHKFFHPWSLHSFGKEYGYAKLKEVIPLRDYMTLPNVVVEALIDGIVEGERQRFEDDGGNTPPQKDDALEGLTKEQLRELKKLGLKKP